MRSWRVKKNLHNSGWTYYLLGIFIIFSSTVYGQKPWYSKAETSWADTTRHSGRTPEYTVYLIGDAGAPDFENPSALQVLRGHLNKADTNSIVVFLGDNIYPAGMPEPDSKKLEEAEVAINGQLDILKDFKGRIVFVPGNHDWDHWSPQGLEGIRREEAYIEKYLDRGNVFLPDQGCPGPSVTNLTDDLVLVSIDTQWWLHKWDKTDQSNKDCPAQDDESFLAQLDEVLSENNRKQIIVVAHHPIFTNGNHGGYYPLKDYVFPLTAKFHNLYVPMPGLGSVYPMMRKHLGHIQDLPHPRYQLLASGLQKVFSKYDNLVFATGHDHNLQYIAKGDQHYIVSGSGSKTTYVARRHGASFTYARQGFVKLEHYYDSELWLEAWVTGEEIDDKGVLAYGKRLVQAEVFEVEDIVPYEIDFADSSITVIAGENYRAGKFKTFMLGKHYRAAWLAPIEVPLMDLTREEGGLIPKQIGGGFQTKSLRLGNEEGKEYVFRSINKDPKKILDKALRETWVADIMQDQISMAHPYGAFVIAPLAEAVGIYHKHPKLVYVPDDPKLGAFRGLYKNTLALYEERASKHLEDYENFGGASKAINTKKLLERLYANNNSAMDAVNLLRNRLFDIWVGDWDRHEDQWRWVKYKCEKEKHGKCHHGSFKHASKGSLYRPIPRDRDQVFVILDGMFPWLVRRKWAARLLPHFQNEIKDMEGLNINGGHIDRSFLNGLSREEWIHTAEEIQASLTDEVIEKAIRQWPDTIFALDGLTIIDKLKHRRDLLVESAERYYEILAKQVDIIGTHGGEFFEITRLDDEHTQIKAYAYSEEKVKGHILYNRILKSGETKEIRIYGQGGNDHFEVSGVVRNGILIRLIGGEGEDSFSDESNVKGLGKKTRIYDDLTGNQVNVGSEAKNLSSDASDIHSYDRKKFKYNYKAPQISLEYNVDDGLFIGGGAYWKNYGFRKQPFSSTHLITGSIAQTGAFNFFYKSRFTHLLKKWDLNLDLAVLAPNSTTNYFGLGNHTVDLNIDKNYHLVRFNGVDFHPALVRTFGKVQDIKFGLGYRYVDAELTPNRFVSDISAELNDLAFDPAHFGSIGMTYTVEKVDKKVIPRRGYHFSAEAVHSIKLQNDNAQFTRLSTEARLYIPFNYALKTVVALRAGVATNVGDFEFYNANTLGATTVGSQAGMLRGYKRDRFSGRTAVYQNAEVRIKLFNFRSYLFPGQFGVLAYADQGKVWTDDEMSVGWHQSFGGGVWISPFNEAVITLTYQGSPENELFNLSLGFLF